MEHLTKTAGLIERAALRSALKKYGPPTTDRLLSHRHTIPHALGALTAGGAIAAGAGPAVLPLAVGWQLLGRHLRNIGHNASVMRRQQEFAMRAANEASKIKKRLALGTAGAAALGGGAYAARDREKLSSLSTFLAKKLVGRSVAAPVIGGAAGALGAAALRGAAGREAARRSAQAANATIERFPRLSQFMRNMRIAPKSWSKRNVDQLGRAAAKTGFKEGLTSPEAITALSAGGLGALRRVTAVPETARKIRTAGAVGGAGLLGASLLPRD